jgi:predicted dehydrogenase
MVNFLVKKKFLVCGTGSIGVRHIKNLLKLKQEVYVWREQKDKRQEINKIFPKIKIFTSLNKAIKFSDAVIIANSTHNHIKVLKKAIKYKRHAYIEKPVSNNIKDIKKLLISTKKIIIEVGYQFRNHPNLIYLKKILEKKKTKIFGYRFVMGHDLKFWRKKHNYSKSYTSDLKKGGGALLELIHQIDLAIWFFGPIKKIIGVRSKVSNLNINADDLTNIIIVHKNAVAGQIQLDMISPVYRCEAEILTKKSIFTWLYNKGIIFKDNSRKKIIIHKTHKSFKRNDLFIKSMLNFINRVNNYKIKPICSFEDGIKSLIAANEINKRIN